METIITAVISVLVASRLLRACRDLADQAETACPSIARAIHKAILEPVDAFLEAQGYITTSQQTEAAQRADIAVQERDAATARADGLVDHLAKAALKGISLEGELAEARKSGGADPLFSSVGLHAQAEPMIIAAARMAYRKKISSRHHTSS